MPSQVELIGHHPIVPDIFEYWFSCTDYPTSDKQCHRSLISKINANDPKLLNWLANKIIEHHCDPEKLERLKKAYANVEFPKYAEQHRQIPVSDRTQKGNATEIVLVEYICSCQSDRQLFKVFKFRYNTNVDQSMKGDDALMVDLIKDDKGNDALKIYLGEAKFRGVADKPVLNDLSEALGKDKLPISYSFLVDQLYKDPDTEVVADLLNDFVVSEVKAKNNLKYAGLLLSDPKAAAFVEKNFSCDNNAMVIISAGIEKPQELVQLAFEKAAAFLAKPDQL